MKQQLTTCDRCGKKFTEEIISIFVAVDRKLDAAGSMDTEHEVIDLCHECCRNAIQAILDHRNRSYEENQNWYRIWSTKK